MALLDFHAICGFLLSAFILLNLTRRSLFFMTSKGDYRNALESAIRMRHKCSPTHKQTVFVRAKTEDEETVWEGLVEEFDLSGHGTAKTCYAWRHTEPDGKSKIITIPRNKFINSAQMAVEAAIFTDAQPPVLKFSHDLQSLTKQIQECKELIRKMGIKSEDLSASIDAATHVPESMCRKGSHNCEI